MAEILEALPRLSDVERQRIFHQLVQMDAGLEIEETPEMLAAIDAGIESLKKSPGVPIEQARKRLDEWITK